VITGPTASGKSRLAIELASLLGGEIVSADSMQVYRYMDIGTAKPTVEERGGVIHYMIDILNPDEEFNAVRYRKMATEVIEDLIKKGKKIFVVGGTGLYIRALVKGFVDIPAKDMSIRDRLEKEIEIIGAVGLHERLKGLDPTAASRIHPNDRVRIIRALEVYYQTDLPISQIQERHGFMDSHYDTLIIGISMDRGDLYRKIEARTDRMMEDGIVDEVKGLLEKGYGPELKPMQALGYKQITEYIVGRVDLGEALRLLKRDTRRYAKRQITWFNKEDGMHWLSDKGDMLKLVEGFYEVKRIS
ncbi:MAG: tRNA (adenosine(37)-N6)-dimethylallyltransferase MiaA, partial [Thermodesulfobacteriota bacterium]